jgi:hypothetical protein
VRAPRELADDIDQPFEGLHGDQLEQGGARAEEARRQLRRLPAARAQPSALPCPHLELCGLETGQHRRRGFEEPGRRLGCPVEQAGRQPGPASQRRQVERLDARAGCEEGERHLAGAGRTADQSEADPSPLAELRFAEPPLERAGRLGEARRERLADPAETRCVARGQLGNDAHDSGCRRRTASLLEDCGDDLFE